jgi:hypothetical protein
MKLWDPPRSLKDLRKRASLYLLLVNVIVATTNLIMLSARLDDLSKPRTMVCQMVSMRTIACADK